MDQLRGWKTHAGAILHLIPTFVDKTTFNNCSILKGILWRHHVQCRVINPMEGRTPLLVTASSNGPVTRIEETCWSQESGSNAIPEPLLNQHLTLVIYGGGGVRHHVQRMAINPCSSQHLIVDYLYGWMTSLVSKN